MKSQLIVQIFVAIIWFHTGAFAFLDLFTLDDDDDGFADEQHSDVFPHATATAMAFDDHNDEYPPPFHHHERRHHRHHHHHYSTTPEPYSQRLGRVARGIEEDKEYEDTLQVPSGYSNIQPPKAQGNVAEFNVLIFSVRDINELNMEISLEVRLQIFWQDQRLVNWSKAIPDGQSYIVLHHKAIEQIWIPDIYVENLKKVTQPILMAKPASVRVYRDAMMRFSTRTTLTMACKMAFQYYPADTQICPIEMKSYAYDDPTLKIKWSEGNSLTVIDDKLELPNFDLYLDEKNETFVVTRNNNRYSGIKIIVILTRKLAYHLIQTYVPSSLFVVVSWLSFLVPPESVPGRMAICMTTLLTLTSMFAAVRQNVPKVSYVKAIDIWMVTCIFFVFLTLLEYTIVLKLRSKIGRCKKAKPVSSLIPRQSLGADMPSLVVREKCQQGPGGGVPTTQNSAPPSTAAGAASAEPDSFQESVKVLEKYCWAIIIILFLLFNFVYWPWLIIYSEHSKLRNKTVYYNLS